MLEGLVENNGFANNQPVVFTSVGSKAANVSNDPPSTSSGWQALYDASKLGQTIPPPYIDFTSADATALNNAIAAYRSVMTGATPRAQLPDVTDVVLPAAKPLLVFEPQAGQTAQQILVQACGQCHNSRLDQSQSRASFNAFNVSQLSRPIKDLAITRLNLPPGDAQHMPPARFRSLRPADLAAVTQLLQQ